MSTTQGKLYFTALSSLERLEIQFVPPTLNNTRTANISELAVVGRNNPLQHFTSGAENLSLELDFYSETENRFDVMEKVSWLKSLAAADGFAGSQEKVRLTFGRMFRNNEVWTVRSVSSRFELFDEQNGYLPRQAYVTIELSLDPDTNLRREDIKWKGIN